MDNFFQCHHWPRLGNQVTAQQEHSDTDSEQCTGRRRNRNERPANNNSCSICEDKEDKMVRYAKSCCCFPLRYGVILVAAVDIILGVFILTITAVDLVKQHETFQHHVNKAGSNDTERAGKNVSKDESFQASSIINLALQVVEIAIAVSLIVVVFKNNAKYRKVLFVWMGWTFGSAIMLVVTTILRSVNAKISWIEICMMLLIACFQVFCIWLVMSYYRLLAVNADAGYDAFSIGKNKDDEMYDTGEERLGKTV